VQLKLQYITIRDCNPGIPAVFANSESRDWQRLNPVISGLQKLAKILLFCILNDRNKNFCRLVNKIFLSVSVLLCAIAGNLYFDSHSLQFGYTFRRGRPVHKTSQLIIGQNNDQSVSLIPKRDPVITNFSIPDPGIENPIPGLQSLITILRPNL